MSDPRPDKTPTTKRPSKETKKPAQLPREQTETETEQRPYLDTEGGE